MDLDKVIFVDAGKYSGRPIATRLLTRLDQIVRVDMKELVNVDLQGKVYGMAPMGDDRTEMEGFRFWKTGYWKDALHGLPYHIRLEDAVERVLAETATALYMSLISSASGSWLLVYVQDDSPSFMLRSAGSTARAIPCLVCGSELARQSRSGSTQLDARSDPDLHS